MYWYMLQKGGGSGLPFFHRSFLSTIFTQPMNGQLNMVCCNKTSVTALLSSTVPFNSSPPVAQIWNRSCARSSLLSQRVKRGPLGEGPAV